MSCSSPQLVIKSQIKSFFLKRIYKSRDWLTISYKILLPLQSPPSKLPHEAKLFSSSHIPFPISIFSQQSPLSNWHVSMLNLGLTLSQVPSPIQSGLGHSFWESKKRRSLNKKNYFQQDTFLKSDWYTFSPHFTLFHFAFFSVYKTFRKITSFLVKFTP